MSDLLEPDKSSRNLTVFIAALLICAGFSGFYFIRDNGCSQYAKHLKTCTPYSCSQRVIGFENEYMGQKAVTLNRQIIGPEKDQFFDVSLCKVIEIDDVDKPEQINCKYTDKTKDEVIKRSAILFGTEPVTSDSGKNLSSAESNAVRASYATRTPEQAKECTK